MPLSNIEELEIKTDSMNQQQIIQLIFALSNQMTGLKRLVDLSASGIEQYIHPEVMLENLTIYDNSGN